MQSLAAPSRHEACGFVGDLIIENILHGAETTSFNFLFFPPSLKYPASCWSS